MLCLGPVSPPTPGGSVALQLRRDRVGRLCARQRIGRGLWQPLAALQRHRAAARSRRSRQSSSSATAPPAAWPCSSSSDSLSWRDGTFRPDHLVRRAAWVSLVFMVTEALVGAGIVLLGLVADNDSARPRRISRRAPGQHLPPAGRHDPDGLVGIRSPGTDPCPLDWRRLAPMLGVLGGLLLVGITGAITALGDTLVPGGLARRGHAAGRLSDGAHPAAAAGVPSGPRAHGGRGAAGLLAVRATSRGTRLLPRPWWGGLAAGLVLPAGGRRAC